MTVNIDKELFPKNTGGAVPTYDVDGNIESVEKLDGELTYRTGITTQEGFRKSLKDLGQDVPYFATPETLRAAFTEINGGGFPEPEDPEKITFGVHNGIVGELVNEEAGGHAEAGTAEELVEDITNPEISSITVTNDIQLTSTPRIDHNLTINGNGNTILADGSRTALAVVGDDVEVTLNNVTIKNEGEGVAVQIGTANMGTERHNKVTVGADATIESNAYGVTIFGEGSELVLNGKLISTGIAGDESYAIAGNGSESYNGNSIITINEGAEIDADDNSFCIYHPQNGTININGGYLHGQSVIGLKSGRVNINGGRLVANGVNVEPVHENSGQHPTGDVIAVEVNNNYYGGKTDKNIQINVTGGTLESENAYKIREFNVNAPDITIEVDGKYSVKTEISDKINVYDDHEIDGN